MNNKIVYDQGKLFIPVEPQTIKTSHRCDYCGRISLENQETCSGCGAPLSCGVDFYEINDPLAITTARSFPEAFGNRSGITWARE